MAEWEHKERNWSIEFQDDVDGFSVYVIEWVDEYTSIETSDYLSFSEWLNWQCKNGWEVFKIRRSGQKQKTWCIFRRLV